MYSSWPRREEIGDYARIDGEEMKVKASKSDLTALHAVEVPTYFGDFVVGASAYGVATLFWPGFDEFEISGRFDYYGLAAASWGSKMAIEAGLELMGYALGEVRNPETPIDLSYLTSFQQDVLHAVRSVPYGETVTLKELAQRAGHARKYAPVSRVLKHNPLPVFIPCHRVLATGGGLGDFCGPIEWKQFLLEHEGVQIQQAFA